MCAPVYIDIRMRERALNARHGRPRHGGHEARTRASFARVERYIRERGWGDICVFGGAAIV